MNRTIRNALGVLSVTVLCSMTAAGVASSAPAAESPLASFSPEIAKELSRLPLDEQLGMARTARMMPLLLSVESLPGFVDAGYSRSTGDEVEILWHGQVTSDLKDAIAKNLHPETTATIVSLDFTAADIDDLVDEVAAELDRAKISYDSIGPSLKYKSLDIVLLNSEDSIAAATKIA